MDAILANSGATALNADEAQVDKDMVCKGELKVDGEIQMRNARIGRLAWEPSTRFDTVIRLAGTTVGYLDDAAESWPTGLHLDKLTYATLRGLSQPESVSARLNWLGRAQQNEGYRPRSYNQLAKTYQEAGFDDCARKVLMAKQQARAMSRSTQHEATDLAPARASKRTLSTLKHIARVGWDRFLAYSIGYGYRPARILYWLTGAVVGASFAFEFLHPEFVRRAKSTPTDKEFNSFIYTLDLLLPVANLGQRNSFVVYGPAEWLAAGSTIVGWLLGAVLVAGLGGVFKRD